VGGQIQTALAPIRTYPAVALWDEVAGVHVDQSASVLRYLKLATIDLQKMNRKFRGDFHEQTGVSLKKDELHRRIPP
jgi:hypothetical protein